MTETEINEPATGSSIPKLPVAGAIVALAGLADATYLTIHHLTAEPVPCSIIAGCETVLTSPYAEIGGIPLAAFGAVAYFVAFSLALLTIFGNRMTWMLFGIQVILMSIFTTWLLYLQGYVIGAFCQFCLISAITTFTMLIIYIASRFVGRS
ncbi:MAG: hypothetical protein DMF63_18810 [Acidobacteria bacterium]|nr:MAG: hypothetical protein DMF63_18810 [Acidobacteriota bacterium]